MVGNQGHSALALRIRRAKRGFKMSEAGEGQEVLHGTPGAAKRHSQRMSRHVADRQGVPVRANPR